MTWNIHEAKRIELDKARREGREIIEWDVTAEQFRINAKKLNWPAKSVHLKFNEAVAGPPHGKAAIEDQRADRHNPSGL